MHWRRVKINVEISDETDFFLEKIKNLGQNLDHFEQNLNPDPAGGEKSRFPPRKNELIPPLVEDDIYEILVDSGKYSMKSKSSSFESYFL